MSRLVAQIAQYTGEQRGTGYAVDIVITVDKNLLIRIDRLPDTRNRLFHIRQAKRIGKPFDTRIQKLRNVRWVLMPPIEQYPRKSHGYLVISRYVSGGLLVRLGNHPAFGRLLCRTQQIALLYTGSGCGF